MSLAVVTVTAGLVSTVPSTATRPSATQRSASRREHSPARAITLAIRSGAMRSEATLCCLSMAGCVIYGSGLARSGSAVRDDEIGQGAARGNGAMARALDEAVAAGAAG